MLEDLIISRVRVKLLQIFLTDPGQIIHVRELVRRTKEEINAVRRELAHMERAGMVSKEQRANRLYYSFRKDYPLYFDLLELITKTTGLGGAILKNRNKLGKVKFAMLSGKFARNIPGTAEKVDLLIIGNVVIPEVAALVREEELRRNREIFFTPMTEEEYAFRKKKKDPFILDILESARLMIIGDEEELISGY
ncbi:MAG: Transcriptional regulator [Microgenomates group bacterium GW2011_GWA1_48_10]|nr:MAG: Transcriptional regulator [Microgenomates group bacterium GW2011_GWA1_48_10]